ncbi:hypothetical protein Pdw03_4952 [Penicillium digitatum]|uniref:Uncharacterized protein n=1 Tax=Penicillium digitatum TaxID=36651 RepID=A0A7T6XJ39_PENDI|nr:hypothetical protein Pdw03_4952 [Penicillium digitatum]
MPGPNLSPQLAVEDKTLIKTRAHPTLDKKLHFANLGTDFAPSLTLRFSTPLAIVAPLTCGACLKAFSTDPNLRRMRSQTFPVKDIGHSLRCLNQPATSVPAQRPRTFVEHARDHPDQWFEYCRRAYDYIESTQSEATNARERVDQAERQLQAARIKITRLSSELTAAERDHLRDVAFLEYQKKLYDEAQQNIARIEAARMCAAELAIPTGNTVPPPVPEPAAEPGVAAAMGTPPSLSPESSGSHRLAMEGEMHNEALPTMLEQAINRELKGMLLHHEPPKGDYLDLARILQNLENRRVQYDSGPSTAPRTYSAAIRTAPKAPELNSGRPGPEQTATTEEPPATAEEPPATTEEPPATAEEPLPLKNRLLPLKNRLLPLKNRLLPVKSRPRNLPARPTGLEKRDIAAVSLAACAAYARKKYSMFAITTADIETALNPKTDTEPDPVSSPAASPVLTVTRCR